MPRAGEGWLIIGMMVRVMRFQSSLNEIGMTGWTFRLYCMTLFGPMPKLKLFWKGTLIMLAMGFWAALASASWSSAALAAGSAPAAAPPVGAVSASARVSGR